jgi:Ca2+-binding RTX toxin-like protein
MTTVATIPELSDYLITGYWSSEEGLPQGLRWASNTVSVNITGLVAEQQAAATAAFTAWESICNINFVFTTGPAQITYVNAATESWTDRQDDGNGHLVSVTKYFGTDVVQQGAELTQLFLHETGHEIGLGHLGPYHADGTDSYAANAIFANDTWQYSVMSYWSPINYGASGNSAVTPQMADIYAAQAMYGAVAARTGNTVYGFNSNAGPTYDFTQYAEVPGLTIYDTGGIDTLDCSGYSNAQTIDLTAGAFSSIGGSVNNLGIYLTSTIENAIGGGAADIITGNAANNSLNGGGGADTITGLGGNDTLDGGTGNDTMIGGTGNDSYVVDSASDVVDETGGDGVDLVLSSVSFNLSDTIDAKGAIENLTLTGSAAIGGTGNALANVITGNAGNNSLAGLGGADTLNGGAGSDTANYVASAAGVNVSLQTGTSSGGDAAGDTLVSIENLTGSNSNDTLEGNAGNNVLSGGANGSGGDTVSYANATAGVTVDLTKTVAQNTGGAGSDTLVGFENLTGSAFNDTLTGKAGTNVLNGLAGNDKLAGGAAADILTGGTGNDTFIFKTKTESSVSAPDLITDFVHGVDQIDLSALDANTRSSGNQAFDFDGNSTSVFKNGVSWYESAGKTVVQADINGDTTADVMITLTGTNLHLSASDFIL